jgi:hypothetical protein
MPIVTFRCMSCRREFEEYRTQAEIVSSGICPKDGGRGVRMLMAPRYLPGEEPPRPRLRREWAHFGHAHFGDDEDHGH